MVHLALQDDAYLEACSAYQEVWDTEEVKKDENRELNVSPVSLCQRVMIELALGHRKHHHIRHSRTL